MEAIKGLFKFLFIFIAITTVVVGAGIGILALVFKNDFKELEQKTQEIVSDIESNN